MNMSGRAGRNQDRGGRDKSKNWQKENKQDIFQTIPNQTKKKQDICPTILLQNVFLRSFFYENLSLDI